MKALPCSLFYASDRTATRRFPDFSFNRLEPRTNHKLGPQAAGAQLRAREIEIVAFLELVIGELVARGHSNAIRRATLANHVDPGQLRLFPTIFSVGGYRQRSERRQQHGTIALVEPLRGN